MRPEVSTFEELCAWMSDNFEMINGTPQAYMEFPISIPGKGWFLHREVYSVISIGAVGKRRKWERPMVLAMQATLIKARFDAVRACGYEDVQESHRPVMFVRRMPEFSEESGMCRIYLRCTIPGCNLNSFETTRNEGSEQFMLANAS